MHRRIAFLIVLSMLYITVSISADDDSNITINIVGKKPDLEMKTRADLEKLLKHYDLSRYIFTNKIQIEYGVIPHSHPVLTLDTDYAGDLDKLLTGFLHEQLHWWLDENSEAERAAVEEFMKRYPTLPTDRRDLARNEYSTYMHLIVCYLELVSLRDVAGEEIATEVFNWLKGHHYRWIYRTVLQDEAEIAKIVSRHGLMVPNE